MPFLNRFQHNAAGKIVTDSTPVGQIIVHDGLAYDETVADSLAINSAGAAAAIQAGIAFDSSGSMLVVDASAGLPADTKWQSGLPISAAQARLCVDAAGAVTYYHQGVGFTAVGAVAIA